MTSCLGFPRGVHNSTEATNRSIECMRDERHAMITARALIIISLVMLLVSVALVGMSTLSPETTLGLGMFFSLGATFVGVIGGGVLLGALAHFAIASVRNYQKSAWQHAASTGFH